MNLKVSRRYSQAFYDASIKLNKLEQIVKDAGMLLNLLKSSQRLDLFFKSPVIRPELKNKIVKEIFKQKIENVSLNFILLLIKHHRENIVKQIFEDFINLDNEKKGIVDIKLTTAVTLNDSEKKKLSVVMEKYTKKKANMGFSVDKKIIGGFTAQIGESILDASLRRQLDNLKIKFKETDIKK